ncbi:hypothetical protein SEA_ZOOMAN_337 [Microbacterium phage Zooman]|nr:hypothetical protein SEA_ZOOMAN_24 [Microbacterium phage Zooman]UDL16578.1 hypothetical protein SEA_ZOOMAN_337 [Microbacterium phage Zooman]
MTETQNYQTSIEGDSYDESYMAHSPEYRSTVSRWGRMLTPAQVEDILTAHSFSVADLIEDTHDPIVLFGSLPERLDAAMLYAWLGY